MREIQQIKTAVLGFLAGAAYLWLIPVDSMYIGEMHIYIFLAALTSITALASRLTAKLRSEEVILLNTLGVFAAVLFHGLFIEAASGIEFLNNILLTLFIGSHFSMIGAFTGTLIRKIKFREIPKAKKVNKHMSRYQFSDYRSSEEIHYMS